jgi:hypothetical protein
MRKVIAIVLGVLGAGAIGLAIFLQYEDNATNRVNSILGETGGSNALQEGLMPPLVVGGVGVLLILVAVLLLIIPAKVEVVTSSTLTPGWYDDPESPSRIRYWDGRAWTDKSADKT